MGEKSEKDKRMKQITITITGCAASPDPAHCQDGDQIKWCSTDVAYQLTGLGAVLGSVHQVNVPLPPPCTAVYTVTGGHGPHNYQIDGSNCPPIRTRPPSIIIDP
jgi:hypothetical protein